MDIFIQPTTDGHLDCFQLEISIESPTMNVSVSIVCRSRDTLMGMVCSFLSKHCQMVNLKWWYKCMPAVYGRATCSIYLLAFGIIFLHFVLLLEWGSKYCVTFFICICLGLFVIDKLECHRPTPINTENIKLFWY